MRTEPTTLPRIARTTFAAVTTTPSAARSFVRDTLRAWDLEPLLDSAELIASELVTNAVKATRSTAQPEDCLHDQAPVSIELRLGEGVFRIAVQDNSSEQPTLQALSEDAENGRGLFLVQALSARWDVFFVADGKVTWAEWDVPRHAPATA